MLKRNKIFYSFLLFFNPDKELSAQIFFSVSKLTCGLLAGEISQGLKLLTDTGVRQLTSNRAMMELKSLSTWTLTWQTCHSAFSLSVDPNPPPKNLKTNQATAPAWLLSLISALQCLFATQCQKTHSTMTTKPSTQPSSKGTWEVPCVRSLCSCQGHNLLRWLHFQRVIWLEPVQLCR